MPRIPIQTGYTADFQDSSPWADGLVGLARGLFAAGAEAAAARRERDSQAAAAGIYAGQDPALQAISRRRALMTRREDEQYARQQEQQDQHEQIQRGEMGMEPSNPSAPQFFSGDADQAMRMLESRPVLNAEGKRRRALATDAADLKKRQAEAQLGVEEAQALNYRSQAADRMMDNAGAVAKWVAETFMGAGGKRGALRTGDKPEITRNDALQRAVQIAQAEVGKSDTGEQKPVDPQRVQTLFNGIMRGEVAMPMVAPSPLGSPAAASEGAGFGTLRRSGNPGVSTLGDALGGIWDSFKGPAENQVPEAIDPADVQGVTSPGSRQLAPYERALVAGLDPQSQTELVQLQQTGTDAQWAAARARLNAMRQQTQVQQLRALRSPANGPVR